MKLQNITPLYEVVDILVSWPDDCFDEADRWALAGDVEMAKKWEQAGFEAQNFARRTTSLKLFKN